MGSKLPLHSVLPGVPGSKMKKKLLGKRGVVNNWYRKSSPIIFTNERHH